MIDDAAPLRVDAVRNELEIQFFGLQRSGNHAVLSWLFQQFEQPVYFFNMVKPFTDPVLNWRHAGLPNMVDLPRGLSPQNPRAEEIEAVRRKTLEGIRKERKHALVHSYENLKLADLKTKPLIDNREEWLGQSRCIYRVLLLRDFYNWIASRIRLKENITGNLPRQVDSMITSWVSYAKEYIGETTFLGREGVVCISYNRWFGDERYRKELCGELGLIARDLRLQHVPEVGGGSSFDGVAFAANPGDMQVRARWEYLREDRLRDLTASIRERQSEIECYNTDIFGPSPLLS
jgi:hypothetical protein